jgi:hypothetical protein
MKPVNTKSLLAFVFGQMDKLDNNLIDVKVANAQAKLMQQANIIVGAEHERVRIQIELEKHNKEFGGNLKLRNIESINFD